MQSISTAVHFVKRATVLGKPTRIFWCFPWTLDANFGAWEALSKFLGRIQGELRLKPALFRQDLIALLDLLQQQKIKPIIAQRCPLAEARQAQELLGKGGVVGKIVLVSNGPLHSETESRGE